MCFLVFKEPHLVFLKKIDTQLTIFMESKSNINCYSLISN